MNGSGDDPTDSGTKPAAGDEAVGGTFVVVAADGPAVLRDAHTGRTLTVSDGEGADLETGDVVEARLHPDESGVTWRLGTVDERRSVAIERVEEPPTAHERSLVPDEAGDLVRTERAGEGELHVIAVPADGTEAAVSDVFDDEVGLRARAARLGVERVEVRSAPGIVCVRYLP